MCPIDCTDCGEWEGCTGQMVNHTSWVAAVNPSGRPKSVPNRCVIFDGVFVLPY